MKPRIQILAVGLLTLLPDLAAQAASPVITGVAMAPVLTIQSDTNVLNQIQYTNTLSQGNWATLTNLVVTQSPYSFADVSAPPAASRYYRVLSVAVPSGMALIPAGTFIMGDAFGEGGTNERPVHAVSVSGFYMDTNLVTYALWQQVYQWATNHGYSFDDAGSSYGGYNYSKGDAHPVHLVNWNDAVKWCNAHSEMQSLPPCYYTSAAQTTVYRTGDLTLSNACVNWNASSYRLPTEAEWEKAARGASDCRRFPWGDTNVITWSRANYQGDPADFSFDLSSSNAYQPTFSADGIEPYTSPAGYFAPNGYGLCDMAGNVWEWCWDWYDPAWYAQTGATQNDTRGPTTSPAGLRVLKGGSWYENAGYARCSYRGYTVFPSEVYSNVGFRCVRGL
jgi:formylglycine-generating enzyme required for sulfatase activity